MTELPAMVPTTDSLPELVPVSSSPSCAFAARPNRNTFEALPELRELGVDDEEDSEDSDGDSTRPSDQPSEEAEGVSLGKARHDSESRYDAGRSLRIRSDTSGGEVDAVITDSTYDSVKVVYFRGARCYSKVLSKRELEKSDPPRASGTSMVPGAPVMVRSSSVNAWFKGTVLSVDGDMVKVHWWHNGLSCAKVLRKTSPHLRVCFRKMHSMVGERSPMVIHAAGAERTADESLQPSRQ